MSLAQAFEVAIRSPSFGGSQAMRRYSSMLLLLALMVAPEVFGQGTRKAQEPSPKLRLSLVQGQNAWETGLAVESRDQQGMAVFLWFYEWNMFDAVKKGEHTQGT